MASSPKNEKPEFAVMPEELRLAFARLKKRAPRPVVLVPVEEAFPFSTAAAAEAAAAKDLKIGKFVQSKGGIFIGTEEHLGQTFNLFASRRDVNALDGNGKKILLSYNDTVKHVAGLKNLDGFDGGNFPNENSYGDALKSGQWFIPPKHILHGKDIDGKVVRPENNLYALCDKEDFKDTFTTTASGSGNAHWYWSCTERRDDTSGVYNVDFTVGDASWNGKDSLKFSSRVVRAELRTP